MFPTVMQKVPSRLPPRTRPAGQAARVPFARKRQRRLREPLDTFPACAIASRHAAYRVTSVKISETRCAFRYTNRRAISEAIYFLLPM